MKIAIDIGHNCSYDGGAVGIGNENVMNMETGKRVIEKLKALGNEVLLVTPNSATSLGNSLEQRVSKANAWGANLYVSIHYNCGGGHGVEIWAGSKTSASTAQKVLNEIVTLGFTNRGVKIQGQDGYGRLYVLNNTTMPAILTEGCFLDSQEDMNRYNPEDLANAIVKGITGQVSNTGTQPAQVKSLDYDRSIPSGDNIFKFGNGGYIETTSDGRLIIHRDRGNYISLEPGKIIAYYNDGKGTSGSKQLVP